MTRRRAAATPRPGPTARRLPRAPRSGRPSTARPAAWNGASHPWPGADTMPATPAFTVRPAGAGDLPAVQALLRASELPLDGLDEQFGANYAVAVAEGQVIGVEGIERHGADGLLRSAAVVDAWRGRGVGDVLTRDRLDWARANGLRAVYLLTTTAADYFPRFGFVTARRDDAPDGIRASREFAEACPASAAFMCLPLSSRFDS
jgi:amino-acid N-acetyltransferase